MSPNRDPKDPLRDGIAAPGSLRIKERRSWPTWALLAAALVAGSLGALIGYLPDSGATNSGPSGPSFPSGPTPTTGAIVRETTTTFAGTTTTLRRSSTTGSPTTTAAARH
ncbi:MAG TPA: hypothetical protein VMS00_00650 [Acidimicrobiales bacterium]|nr:hypothetical protein [Acidimicrobiales bacterium]